MKVYNKNLLTILALHILTGQAFSLVVPVTGVSLTATALTNAGVLAINSTKIPFFTTAGSNTGIINKELLKTNKKLTPINNNIVKNRIKDESQKIINLLYGQDKLSGSTWIYDKDDKIIEVKEMNISAAIQDIKNNFTDATDITNFNPSNVLFYENLGMGNGEMTTFDLSSKPNSQLQFEIDLLDKIARMKRNLIDTIDKRSRYTDYIDNIDETMTVKSSVDLKNLMALEKLIRNKVTLEETINSELSETYKIIQKKSVQKNVAASTGTLHIFTIKN